MLIGIVVALAGSVIGAGHTRKRRDIPRAWWLRFWTSRLGGSVARVAGLGLGGPPTPNPAPERGAGSGERKQRR